MNTNSPTSSSESPVPPSKLLNSAGSGAGISFQPHSLGSYVHHSPMKSESGVDLASSVSAAAAGSFGSISAAAAAAAAMFGQPGPAGQSAPPGGPGVDLGAAAADLRLNHPAITQWLQQAQQAQQHHHHHPDHSPPSNDEPMERESSPHSSGGGAGSDYAAL
jgi:hypothetical protein